MLIGWQMPDAMIEIAEGKTLDQLLDEWIRKRWGPNFENLPGRDDLLALAREEVSPNVSEAQVRHLRKKYATAEAIKGGANFHRNKRSQ